MPNFSSLAGLEVAEKFLWGVGGVGWGGVGWGGLHSHFRVTPNRCVVLCWGWGFDNFSKNFSLRFFEGFSNNGKGRVYGNFFQ